jgi:hypothetical protein
LDTIYIIRWYFYDHSDSGILPYAYANKDEAVRALEMLNEHGSRQYLLEELAVLRSD